MTDYFRLLTLCVSLFICTIEANEYLTKVTHSLKSKSVNQTVKFDVILPYGYKDNLQRRYPVLFTTAGKSRQHVLMELVDWLSHVSMGPMPQMIIVTIPQLEAESDLHPKDVSSSGITNKPLLALVKDKLIPFVDEKYRTQPFRLLEGYSSNGNFPLFVYRFDPEVFSAYLVSSPALVNDKSGLVDSFADKWDVPLYKHKYLHLTLGAFKQNIPYFENIQRNLEKHELNVDFLDMSKENFLSVPVLSFDNAINNVFSDLAPDMKKFKSSGLNGLYSYFQNLNEKYGYKQDISPAILDLALYYSDLKQHEKAIEIITQLTTQFPDNIFYMTRRAAIELAADKPELSKQTLILAKIKAKKADNQDALQYINAKLSKL